MKPAPVKNVEQTDGSGKRTAARNRENVRRIPTKLSFQIGALALFLEAEVRLRQELRERDPLVLLALRRGQNSDLRGGILFEREAYRLFERKAYYSSGRVRRQTRGVAS